MFFKNLVLTIIIIAVSTSAAFAQDNADLEGLVTDTKNDLLVVVGGGLAGAVLGLSTLSFVEEPKEHTRNIIVGASIGIIAGVGFVALSQATKTQDMLYGGEEDVVKTDPKEFNTYARSGWHYSKLSETFTPLYSPYQLGMNLTF